MLLSVKIIILSASPLMDSICEKIGQTAHILVSIRYINTSYTKQSYRCSFKDVMQFFEGEAVTGLVTLTVQWSSCISIIWKTTG